MSRRKQLKPVHLGDDDEDDGKPDSPTKKIKPATDDRGRDQDKEFSAVLDEPVRSNSVGSALDKFRTRTQAKKRQDSLEAKGLQRSQSLETADESPPPKKGKSTSGVISCQHCERTFRTQRGLHTHERQHKKEVVDTISDVESETGEEENADKQQDVEMGNDDVANTVINQLETMKDQNDVQALDMSRSSCENYECFTFVPDTNNNIKNMVPDGKRDFIIDDNGNVSPYLASRTCQICGKFCAKPSDLKRHMLIHSGERPFPCEVCGKSFKAKGSMLYHQKAAHHMDVELSPGLEERYQRQKSRHSFSPRDRSEDKIPFCDLERPSDSITHSYQLYRSVDENNHEVVTVGKPFATGSSSSVYKPAMDGIEADVATSKLMSTLTNEAAYHLPPVFQPTQSQPFENNTVLQDQISALVDSVQEPVTQTVELLDSHSSPKKLKLNSSIGAFIQENKDMLENHFKIKNETVIISRLDGVDLDTKQETTLYKCYLCGRMFKFMSRLQCHLSTHVECEIVTYQCPFCNVHFPYKSQLRPHIKRHLETDGITKDKSLDDIPQQKSLTSDSPESEDEHDNDIVNTDEASSPTKIDSENANKPEETTVYANSVSYRKVNQSYVCRYCRKGFFRLLSLQKHERLVHSQNICKDCDKTFTDFSQLRSHIICIHNHKKDLAKKVRKKAILASLLSSNRAASDITAKKQQENKELENIKEEGTTEEKMEDEENIEKAKEILQQEGINEDVTVVMPTDPLTDQEGCDKVEGDESQTGSETNMSETGSDNGDGDGIMTAPKRSLLSFCKDGLTAKSRRKCSQPVKIENNNTNTQININVKQEMAQRETTDVDKTNVPNMTAASLATAAAMNHLSSVFLANALTATSSLPHVNTSSSPLMLPSPTIMPATTAIPAYPINQFMSVPITVQVPPDHAQALTKPSMGASSSGSSKSSSSPVDRDNLVGFPRVAWTPSTSPNSYKDWKMWAASKSDENTEAADDSINKNVSLDSRKVTSLSRTHSRLHVINSPIDREKVCKPTPLPDGRVVYRCPFCHKDFVSFSDINRHMDFHEDIRPYKCKFCDYYARTNSQLKVHMMRHQGIREYCCKLCSYKGVTQSDLNRHMKSQIHLLKSQNECPHCGEGFVTQKNLTKHLSGNCIIKMYGKLRDSNTESETHIGQPSDDKNTEVPSQIADEVPLEKNNNNNNNNNNNYLKDAYLARYRESQLEQMHKEAVRAVEKAV